MSITPTDRRQPCDRAEGGILMTADLIGFAALEVAHGDPAIDD
jgi:hypothetical protein